MGARGRAVAVAMAFVAGLAGAGAALAGTARHVASAGITVTVTDRSLTVTPTTVAAGRTTFVVDNKGRKRHAFEISGPGLRAVHTGKITAGGSTTLTVTLRPGAYVLSDPVGLSAYDVQYLDIVPNAVVSSTGSSGVAGTTSTTPMCGVQGVPAP